jgi:hypothetical protein
MKPGARRAPSHAVHHGMGLDFHIVFAHAGRVGGIPGAMGFPGGAWRAMRALRLKFLRQSMPPSDAVSV